MKKVTISMGVIFVLTIGLGGILQPVSTASAQDFTKTSYGELSEAEEEALILMREEEKLARDVYMALYDQWGAQIFLNIQASEQTHFDQIGVLLVRYKLPDPALGVGEFSDHHLQEVYDELISIGTTSLADAYWVGAMIEDLDIFDLLHCLEVADNKDLDQVFTNLMEGSENHMRAFVKCLSSVGEGYEPQYISTELYNEILAGETSGGKQR